MGDKKILRTIILITSIVLLCLRSSSLASSIGGMPGGGGMGSTTFISDNSNIPIEARIGEEIDIRVQHDDTLILILFPISLRNDNKITNIKLEKYFKKDRISDTRMRIALDESLLDFKNIGRIVKEPQSLVINYEGRSGRDTSENGTKNEKITFRTQNGFQSYVKSDFNRSGVVAAFLSIVPGLGYSYAEESTSAQYSFFFRTIVLAASLNSATQLHSLWTALSEIFFFAEAKNSVNLVQKKNEVAKDLREKGYVDESQLLLSDLEGIKNKPKKYVKYPSMMFDLSLVAGARLFPFGSTDKTRITAYSGFSIGFRDYFINSYDDQTNKQKKYVRASYYDDFYSFGWKNVYCAGYDANGDQLFWNAGVGKAYHMEWLDLMGGVSVGEYDNPASIYLESRLNLAPLTCLNGLGTYVEVYSPY